MNANKFKHSLIIRYNSFNRTHHLLYLDALDYIDELYPNDWTPVRTIQSPTDSQYRIRKFIFATPEDMTVFALKYRPIIISDYKEDEVNET